MASRFENGTKALGADRRFRFGFCRWGRRIVRLHRYPRYIVDLWAVHILPRWLRRVGLTVGKGTQFLGFPIIKLAPRSSITIGDRCAICSRSSQTALGVNHPVVLRTLRAGAELRIGVGVRLSGTTICAAERVVIGDRCVIGANVTIADTDFHSLDSNIRSSPKDGDCAVVRPVQIGSDVFIGGGSYILKGVKIGERAVIGCASVVTHDVPADTIVVGNPATVVSQVPTGNSRATIRD